MPEAGGPTTQSGIYYQNTIAALYLGRLCDGRERPEQERVSEVRVEAPSDVDDIVVSFADGHKEWVQAKEKIPATGEKWKGLWTSFENELWSGAFGPNDNLVLCAGPSTLADALYEIAERARGASDLREWQSRLTKGQVGILTRVSNCLNPSLRSDEMLFELFWNLQVRISSSTDLSDRIANWIPESNKKQHQVLSILRDKVAGRARNRRTFKAIELIEELQTRDDIWVVRPAICVDEYRNTILNLYSEIDVPGQLLPNKTANIFIWPILTERDAESIIVLDDEDEFQIGPKRTLASNQFPETWTTRAIVVGGGGLGKTSLLTAIAWRTARSRWVPALIWLGEFADADVSVVSFLTDKVNEKFCSRLDWVQICEKGEALLLFDGLDELSAARRLSVWKRINEFSNRFLLVPWLVSVRDVAALSSAPSAPVLSIAPLDSVKILEFCRVYLGPDRQQDAIPLALRIERSPDLRRLARIPLFLTLLIEDCLQQPIPAQLPGRRTELIERYLERSFAVQRYKPNLHLRTSSGALRDAAENIALFAMDEDSPELDERTIRKWATATGVGEIEAALEDLVAVGVLRRNSHRVRFTFPVIQEYLAGCLIADTRATQIVSRFQESLSRPWTQALQFAIEKHSAPDKLIRELLRQEDDAFHTKLRLIGRCIANGTKVSDALRTQVAHALGEFWISHTGRLAESTAELLAGGFARRLPDIVRAHLLEGGGFSGEGGGALLIAAQDDSLTVAVLHALLERLPGMPPLYEWGEAITRVAPDFLDAFVARAQQPDIDASKILSLSVALDSLQDTLTETPRIRTQLIAAVQNSKLPTEIRLIFHRMLKTPLPEIAVELIEHLVHEKPTFYGRIPGLRFAEEALWRLPAAEERWRAFASDSAIDVVARRDIIFSVTQYHDRDSALTLLKSVDEIFIPKSSRIAILITRAYLDDIEAMERLTEFFNEFDVDEIDLWVRVSSHYPKSDCVKKGLASLENLLIPLSRHAHNIGVALSSAMNHQLSLRSLSTTWSSGAPNDHQAKSVATELIWKWAFLLKTLRGRLDLLQIAVELEHPLGVKALRQTVNAIVLAEKDRRIPQTNPLGGSLASALYVLERSEVPLELNDLVWYARQPHSNMSITAFDLLSRRNSIEALDFMIDIYNSLDNENAWKRDVFLEKIEVLSQRLEVLILNKNDGSDQVHLTRT